MLISVERVEPCCCETSSIVHCPCQSLATREFDGGSSGMWPHAERGRARSSPPPRHIVSLHQSAAIERMKNGRTDRPTAPPRGLTSPSTARILSLLSRTIFHNCSPHYPHQRISLKYARDVSYFCWLPTSKSFAVVSSFVTNLLS